MVQTPQFRTDEQRLHEQELRRATEIARREQELVSATRTGRMAAGALRAMSAALTRTANALDTPSDCLERDVRLIDRA
ncbi:MAG: hypothetical protein ABI595_14245 [Actinomycetota bacterium]